MKIVLFGRDGQLGLSLKTGLNACGEVTGFDQNDLDLGDLALLRATLLERKPRVIINAAAYTAVDQAEMDAATAARINAEAPAVMAQTARELGALLIHYSTDYVFDGMTHEPYSEESIPNPLGVYGKTKLAGEEAVRTAGATSLIIRTAWLYSNYGRNFLKTMLRLAGERDELRVVDDQSGTPTYARLVAEASLEMLGSIINGDGFRSEYCGLYHMTCQGQTTWHGFAQRIVELSGNGGRVRVTPISTAKYPTPARRPPYSVLSCNKLDRVFGIRLPHWETALEQCLADARGIT
ncbi:MAG: dTDP-4-dehydrorhamnose reductase [Acidiferrobacterales bacterium]